MCPHNYVLAGVPPPRAPRPSPRARGEGPRWRRRGAEREVPRSPAAVEGLVERRRPRLRRRSRSLQTPRSPPLLVHKITHSTQKR